MTERRIDHILSPKLKKTKEGYIKGNSIVTRTGVLHYLNNDGTSRYELRHPDEVFKPESLDSLKGIPITNDHPLEWVNIDNAAKFTVGFTGENINVDSEFIITSLSIFHKDGIDAVNKGKVELSLGYNVDTIAEEGVYNGEKYTHRQTNIHYNHLAIVHKGRAGPHARLNLDARDNNCLIECDNEKHKKGLNMNMDKDEIQELKFRIDQANNDLNTVKSENIKLELKNRELEEAVKKARTDSLTEANNRVKILVKAGQIINLDNIDTKSNREIMEEVIKSQLTNLDLKDKSDEYVQGRFDSVLESSNGFDPIKSQMSNVTPKFNSDKADINISNVELLKTIQKENIKGRY